MGACSSSACKNGPDVDVLLGLALTHAANLQLSELLLHRCHPSNTMMASAPVIALS